MAEKLGAKWVGNPLNENIAKAVSSIEPLLLDVVFECCGQQEALDTAVEILKPGGKLIIVGIPEFDRWSFSADKVASQRINNDQHPSAKQLRTRNPRNVGKRKSKRFGHDHPPFSLLAHCRGFRHG
jgi:threonine dehydrogenase-like Zn-dependent dehydrogenase